MDVETCLLVDQPNPDAPGPAAARRLQDHGFCALAEGHCLGNGPPASDRHLPAAAAQLALDALAAEVRREGTTLDPPGDPEALPAWRQHVQECLVRGFWRAGREVHALGRRRRAEVRVALDAMLVLGRWLWVAHAGGGQVLLLRRGLVHRLTPDPLASGDPFDLDPDGGSEPSLAPVGRGSAVSPEVMALDLRAGDRVLVANHALATALRGRTPAPPGADPDAMAAHLVRLARAAEPEAPLAVAVAAARSDEEPGADLLPVLKRMTLLNWCNRDELLAVAAVARPERLPAGATVFREGDIGRELYLLVEGRVEVVKDGQRIAVLGPGAAFGELALLDQPERSALVRALEDADLLVVRREAFFGLLKRDPRLAVKILWNLALRLSSQLRATSEELAALRNRA